MTNFRVAIPEGVTTEGEPIVPPWWGPNLRTLVTAFGTQMDANAETVMFARLQALPFAGGANATRQGAARLADGRLIECEPFVLPIHAEQRGLRLYRNEPTISRRVRCARFRPLHAHRATHRGELEHLHPYFLPGVLPVMRIVHQSGDPGSGAMATWHTVDADSVYSVHRETTSNWDWDGATTQWSRWWAIIYLDGVLPEPALWDDGIAIWDDGVTFWGGATDIVMADWVAMLRDWGAAHAACWGVGITWADPAVRFEPSGTSATDPDGWTTYPVGNYGNLVDPVTHLATRPPDVEWIWDRSVP